MKSVEDATSLETLRATVAARYAFSPLPVATWEKVGVATNVRSGLLPLNGVRHLPEAGTSGWYIWAGHEISDDPDFFVPLHAIHLQAWCPIALPYIEAPPGWRFLVAPGYEDLWFDPDIDLYPSK